VIKKSYLDISLVSIGNIFNTLLGFVFLVSIARSLSVEEMGKYALLTGLLTFISKGTDFGTNSLYITNSIKYLNDLKDAFYTYKFISLIILIPISILLLYLLKLSTINIIIIFVLGLFAYTLNYTFYGIFQKQQDYFKLVLLNLSIGIVKIFFSILIFLNIFQPNLEQSFAIFSLSVFFSFFLISYLPKKYLNFNINTIIVKEFFLNAYPAGISLLINQGWTAFATVINSLFKNFTSAGIYYIADKISTIFSLISLSIFTVLLPKNAQRKKENKEFDFNETIFISLALISFAVIGVFASKYFVVPIFGVQYKQSLPILYILLFSASINAICTFMENYFFIEDITLNLLFISLFKVFSFVVISVSFIGFYSVYAVAYASLTSSLITLFLTLFFVFKTHLKNKNLA